MNVVHLFGSVAREENEPQSDIGILGDAILIDLRSLGAHLGGILGKRIG